MLCRRRRRHVFRFADPLFKSELPWSISLSVNQQWWHYDAARRRSSTRPLPRQQIDTILNLTLSVPFDERTTFTVSGGRFVRSPDLPNYAFTNNSVMFGVSWRF